MFASADGDRSVIREKMMTVNEETGKKLKAVLTEDQWEEYEKMVAEQRQRRSDSGRN